MFLATVRWQTHTQQKWDEDKLRPIRLIQSMFRFQ